MRKTILVALCCLVPLSVRADDEPAVAGEAVREGEEPTAPAPPAQEERTDDDDLGVDVTSGAAPVSEAAPVDPATVGAAVRLVVTGGLDGLHDGGQPFWDAAIFRAQGGLPLRVTDANAGALRAEGALFLAREGALDRAAVLAAAADEGARRPAKLLRGATAVGVALDDGEAAKDEHRSLLRALSAIELPVALEQRGRVLAVDLTPDDPLEWPRGDTPLFPVPAVRARYGEGEGAPWALLSRAKGATPRALGIVDRLLADTGAPPTAYVDAGGALAGSHDTTAETARTMHRLLLARSPRALAVGRSELIGAQAAPGLLEEGPFVVGARWDAVPTARVEDIGGYRLAFVALGELGRRMQALLPMGARSLTARESVRAAADAVAKDSADVVVGIALSGDGSDTALTSTSFDAVIHLASSRIAALPAVDDIDFSENHRTGLHAGAGLVRVSSGDVTEVYLWFDDTGRVRRQRIVRHAVLDEGPEAADAVAALVARAESAPDERGGLPARAELPGGATTWTAGDLDALRGGFVREATGADVAVLPSVEPPVPVEGPVPAPLARSWLSSAEPVVVGEVRGAVLRPALAALDSRLSGALRATGANAARRTVAERAVDDLESYTVAVARTALARLEAAGAPLPIKPSPGEDRRLGQYVGDRLDDGGAPVAAAKGALRTARGRARHTFLFDARDIALKFSAHGISGTQGYELVRDTRVQTPSNLVVGINGRLALLYEGPWLAAALVGSSMLDRTALQNADGTETVQEPNDQLLAESQVSVPLARIVGLSPSWLPQPALRGVYQTEWTPSLSVDEQGNPVQLRRRAELRGFLGATWSAAPYIQELRAGAIVENDFAATYQPGALEWGAEVAARGEWKVWALKLSVDSYARGFVPDPGNDTADDLGIVTQTIGRVEVPAFYGVNLALYGDLYFARGKVPATSGVVSSIIFGAALTYADRFKLAL